MLAADIGMTQNDCLEFGSYRLTIQMAFQNFDSNRLMTQKAFHNSDLNQLRLKKVSSIFIQIESWLKLKTFDSESTHDSNLSDTHVWLADVKE